MAMEIVQYVYSRYTLYLYTLPWIFEEFVERIFSTRWDMQNENNETISSK